jgi:hypothetical protein
MKKEERERERKKWIAGHQKQKETNTSSRVHGHHQVEDPFGKRMGIENEANERGRPKEEITQQDIRSTAQLLIFVHPFFVFFFSLSYY